MTDLSPNPTLSVHPDGNRLILRTMLHQKDLAKAIPGTRWDPNERYWTAPLSWGVLWATRAIFGDRIEADASVSQWAQAYASKRVTPLDSIRDVLDLTPNPTLANDDRLFPFQRAGVQYLTTAKRVLLADEMGTGKTIQSITAAFRLQQTPVLVIAPNSMKHQWYTDVLEWWPGAKPIVVEGNVSKRREQIAKVKSGEKDVLIINWEGLRGHSRLAPYGSVALNKCEKHGGTATENSCEIHLKELNDIEFQTVIADEAHRMKNPKSKQTRAAWYLGRQVPEANRFALTGTPIANHPGELWSILHFLSPEDWPSRVKYVDLFCLTGWNPWGGNDIIDLSPTTRWAFDRIFKPMFLRRPKSLVLPQLPAKTYKSRYVDLTPKQRKAYKELRDEFITELDEGGYAYVTNPLQKMLRLLQLCGAYMELDEEKNWLMTDPSSKVSDLADFIQDSEGQRVVVFAESKQLINLAAKRLTKDKVNFTMLTGDVHPAERQKAVNDFQDGKKDVILLTLGVGGEGITLTNADVVFFMERSWSMVKNKQAEDRVHRIGLENPVLIIDQIAPDTVEEHRLEVLTDKGQKLENLVRDEELLRRLLQ